MPRGSKKSYTNKQKRKAQHIEEGYEDRGTSKKEAEKRAWATVNKQDGGAKKKKSKSSSSRSSSSSTKSRKRGRPASSRSRSTSRKAA